MRNLCIWVLYAPRCGVHLVLVPGYFQDLGGPIYLPSLGPIRSSYHLHRGPTSLIVYNPFGWACSRSKGVRSIWMGAKLPPGGWCHSDGPLAGPHCRCATCTSGSLANLLGCWGRGGGGVVIYSCEPDACGLTVQLQTFSELILWNQLNSLEPL